MILLILVATLLVLANAVGVVLVAMQLPGTWLMILLTGLFAWWQWGDPPVIGVATLVSLLVLALAGEIAEFVAGAAGAQKAGGTRKAALLSIVGGVVGALVGTFLVPVPIVGTLLGAAVGAGIGSGVGDKWAGRAWKETMEAAQGAAIGKLTGSAIKIVVAMVMWILVLVALIV